MVSKEKLYRLVYELPDTDVESAERILEGLLDRDPMLRSLRDAPEDDEPTDPEEDAGAAEAREEYRQGKGLTAEEAKRLLLT
ncbi:MAG: hypothetical protein ACR2PL_14745 [Dehalococcoidia bacterium]